MKPLSAYFDDAALYKRGYVAKESKAPRAQGVDIDKLITGIEARVAAILALARQAEAPGYIGKALFDIGHGDGN